MHLNESFITRSGSTLLQDGAPVKFVGANVYWLGLDDSGGAVRSPSEFRVRDVLESAAAFGLNLVRSHMLISSAPLPGAFRPAPGVYDETALATADLTIALCHELGLRLVLPLTDEWTYYHGGRRDFTGPHGLPDEAFYTDARARDDFAEYVTRVLTHTNPLTGRRYAEEPAIMAWETGNELLDAPAPWTREVAGLIRRLAPQHLIAAGTRSGLDTPLLDVDELDIIDVHAYPPRVDRVITDARSAAQAGKAFLLGEYDSRECRSDLLDRLAEEPTVAATAFWSLFGRHDRGGLASNNDGFALHIPGRDLDAMERLSGLRRACAAAGLGPRAIAAAEPEVLAVETSEGTWVRFRGTRDASAYRLQHRDGVEWVDTTGIDLPLHSHEAFDPEVVPGRQYRVVPLKELPSSHS